MAVIIRNENFIYVDVYWREEVTPCPGLVSLISPSFLQRVSTPDKLAGLRKKTAGEERGERRDYRLLWQNAIKQQIMLGRMERENARMLENEEHLAERRLKLDYKDLRSDKICVETWDRILSRSAETVLEEELREGVSVGIPQARRGEAWHLLTSRAADSSLTDSLAEKFPNLTAKYNSLKSQLTSHQHAILIDLGRCHRVILSHCYSVTVSYHKGRNINLSDCFQEEHFRTTDISVEL